MTIDLYHVPGSVPCTSVRLLAGTLGIDLNLKHTNLSKGEHLTAEFLKVLLLDFDLEQCREWAQNVCLTYVSLLILILHRSIHSIRFQLWSTMDLLCGNRALFSFI